MCCPSCCRAADLGTHDWCLSCRDNPSCPSRRHDEWEPIYTAPTYTASTGSFRHQASSSAAEQTTRTSKHKHKIPDPEKGTDSASKGKPTTDSRARKVQSRNGPVDVSRDEKVTKPASTNNTRFVD